jgi:hypothetical protein
MGVAPMVNHKEYYNGEGVGFFQMHAMMSLVNLCMHVIRSCTKNAPTMHQPTCYLVCAGPYE